MDGQCRRRPRHAARLSRHGGGRSRHGWRPGVCQARHAPHRRQHYPARGQGCQPSRSSVGITEHVARALIFLEAHGLDTDTAVRCWKSACWQPYHRPQVGWDARASSNPASARPAPQGPRHRRRGRAGSRGGLPLGAEVTQAQWCTSRTAPRIPQLPALLLVVEQLSGQAANGPSRLLIVIRGPGRFCLSSQRQSVLQPAIASYRRGLARARKG